MPREVSIVFIGDNNDSDYGEKVWDMGKNSERYECLRIQTRTNSDDARPSSIMIEWLQYCIGLLDLLQRACANVA